MKIAIVRATGLIVVLLVLANGAHAQKVIRLYSGAAPGSEKWTHQEKEYFSQVWNTQAFWRLVAIARASEEMTGRAYVRAAMAAL